MAAVTPVGAFGTVDGVAALDAVDAADVPIPFVAVTLKVYATPFVKLLTTHVLVLPLEEQVPATVLPEYAVTVYPVMAEPLMLMGGCQETVADAFDATAVTLIGTDGTALTAMLVDAAEAAEVPAALVAVTLKV